jgi:hypothetical protein
MLEIDRGGVIICNKLWLLLPAYVLLQRAQEISRQVRLRDSCFAKSSFKGRIRRQDFNEFGCEIGRSFDRLLSNLVCTNRIITV